MEKYVEYPSPYSLTSKCSCYPYQSEADYMHLPIGSSQPKMISTNLTPIFPGKVRKTVKFTAVLGHKLANLTGYLSTCVSFVFQLLLSAC